MPKKSSELRAVEAARKSGDKAAAFDVGMRLMASAASLYNTASCAAADPLGAIKANFEKLLAVDDFHLSLICDSCYQPQVCLVVPSVVCLAAHFVALSPRFSVTFSVTGCVVTPPRSH